jgi:hypothetical protein
MFGLAVHHKSRVPGGRITPSNFTFKKFNRERREKTRKSKVHCFQVPRKYPNLKKFNREGHIEPRTFGSMVRGHEGFGEKILFFLPLAVVFFLCISWLKVKPLKVYVKILTKRRTQYPACRRGIVVYLCFFF